MTLNNFVSGFKNSEKINLISVVNNLKMGSSSDWSAGFKKVVDTEMGKEFPNIKSRPLQNVPVNHTDDSNYNSSTSLILLYIQGFPTKAQTHGISRFSWNQYVQIFVHISPRLSNIFHFYFLAFVHVRLVANKEIPG